MFKTLLASTFLLFNVSGSVPQNNAVSYSTLAGSYCLRDTFDTDLLTDTTLDGYDFEIFNNVSHDWNYTPHIQKYNSTFDYYYMEWLERLTISYYKGPNFSFELEVISEQTKMSDQNNTIYTSFSKDDVLSSSTVDFQYLIIWFPNPITVSTDSFKVFNSLFVSTGNSYCTYYNGYYAVVNTNASAIAMFCGPIVVDNNLYFHFSYINGNAYCDTPSYDAQYDYIISGKIQGNNNLLIGGTLINNTIMGRMANIGVFSYVYEPVNYTFGDMVFSVIDAPIYMLSQLFSFELFGLQFYVAFMSIVTVVLICFVLKKII